MNGTRISANVHPTMEYAHSNAYPKAAETMGIDPVSEEPVSSLTDRAHSRLFRYASYDLETDSVDFWWVDWQQGGVSVKEGLDPLWILNCTIWTVAASSG